MDETVRLWDIFTGRSVFEFHATHGSPLTAACLDHRGKRLITGAHDGTVRMWNFNNGACIHEFRARKKEVRRGGEEGRGCDGMLSLMIL